jgi:hypothetical protein
MSFAPPPRPLLSLLLCSTVIALGGCETPHSPGFAKVRSAPATGVAAGGAAGGAAARPLPEGSAEGLPEHLLHEYADREPAPESEVSTWDLPAKSKRLIVELLVLAARDQVNGLRGVMTTQARWGIPDRREYEARPVFANDDGRAFLDTLRQTASRLGRKENLNCPPIMPPAAQNYVRNGAEPMWCFYSSNDGLDILAFKLILEGGSAKIDYVGLHPERPAGMIPPRTGAPPPPMTPIVRRPPGSEMRMPPMNGLLQPPLAAPAIAGDGPPALADQPGNPTQPIILGQPGTVITTPPAPTTPPAGAPPAPATPPAPAAQPAGAPPHP